MCFIVLCEQASFSGVQNFREVTKSWPQKFFVLLRLILNCLEKETVSKIWLLRRVQTYLCIQVVNNLVISLSVFFFFGLKNLTK